MTRRMGLILTIFAGCMFIQSGLSAKKIHSGKYKFRISLPGSMLQITDTPASQGDIYYDSTAHVVFIVSGRDSRFSSVKDYIDCSQEELEAQLRSCYNDSLLSLISCSRFIYYPQKGTELHFRVSVLPNGYNTYLVYFIHHRKKDIQFAFTYKGVYEKKSVEYINNIIQTLKLR